MYKLSMCVDLVAIAICICILKQTFSVSCSQVDLKILLVDGHSHNFLFPPSTSTREISQYIYEHWPAGLHFS